MINKIKAIPYARMKKFLNEEEDDYELIVTTNSHDNTWIISVTDLDIFPLFKESENRITLQFEDIDPEYKSPEPKEQISGVIYSDEIPEEDKYLNAFTKEMAEKVVDFIMKAHDASGTGFLLVNCMAGRSRSGAIVDVARTITGIDYNLFKRDNKDITPNRFVRKLLLEAYENLAVNNGA